jgi:bifunctional DNA-binding transcriptional regulator/antitoxin component of YhaV-PrlF toxin-antitoxin module
MLREDMAVLQEFLTKSKDVEGKPQLHYKFRLTIPNKISARLKLKSKQILFAGQTKSGLVLCPQIIPEFIQIQVMKIRTRIYKGMPYFVTPITIPKEHAKKLNLKRGDIAAFSIRGNNLYLDFKHAKNNQSKPALVSR